MSLYTIADLHLSTFDKTNKSMEVFGRAWADYMLRIENNWRHLITDHDTVIIPGDVSWALSLEEAESDLKFLDSLPGKKILGKGNHDFWWSTMRKHEAFFEKHGISSINFLFNNAHETEDFIIAGTRGWYNDEDATNAPDNADFAKAYNELDIPTYHCIGNHDADHATFDEVLEHYQMESGYYCIDVDGARGDLSQKILSHQYIRTI